MKRLYARVVLWLIRPALESRTHMTVSVTPVTAAWTNAVTAELLELFNAINASASR